MATSTLIQKLDSTALVPSSTVPGGYDLVETPDVSDRRQTEVFIAGEQVFIGDAVALDLVTAGLSLTEVGAQVVRGNSADTARRAVVGIVLRSVDNAAGAFDPATQACAAGTRVEVVVRGICEASCLAHSQGDVLALTGVGSLDTIAAATNVKVAYALETLGAPGLASVFVVGNF